jgi:hypothetical protein
LLSASQKWAPQSLPPIKQDPGEFMVEKAEQHLPETVREKIPERLEKAAAQSLAFGYDTTFGALYAMAIVARWVNSAGLAPFVKMFGR